MQAKGIECNKVATTTSKNSWKWVVESKVVEMKAAIAFKAKSFNLKYTGEGYLSDDRFLEQNSS